MLLYDRYVFSIFTQQNNYVGYKMSMMNITITREIAICVRATDVILLYQAIVLLSKLIAFQDMICRVNKSLLTY